jgi:hypothetical protein
MSFTLTPPLTLDNKTCFSVIKIGDMEFPESLILDMGEFNCAEILGLWKHEINEVVHGRRNKFGIISGIAKDLTGVPMPTEWWVGHRTNDTVVFHYQALSHQGNESLDWSNPLGWWQNIIENHFGGKDNIFEGVSFWTCSLDALENWIIDCETLLNAIENR